MNKKAISDVVVAIVIILVLIFLALAIFSSLAGNFTSILIE